MAAGVVSWKISMTFSQKALENKTFCEKFMLIKAELKS